MSLYPSLEDMTVSKMAKVRKSGDGVFSFILCYCRLRLQLHLSLSAQPSQVNQPHCQHQEEQVDSILVSMTTWDLIYSVTLQ